MQLLSGQQYSPLYILMYARHILESYVIYGDTHKWWTTTKEPIKNITNLLELSSLRHFVYYFVKQQQQAKILQKQ